MVVQEQPEVWRLPLEALRRTPSGLFTDIDGTISPIAPTPDEARVVPEAGYLLGALASRLRVVAAISGRAPEYAAAMVGAPALVYVGNHGLEEFTGGKPSPIPEAARYTPRIAALIAGAREQLTIPGLIWEDKRATGAVHYRKTDDPQLARAEILRVLAPLAEREGLALHEGRMVIEVRPPVNLGKGAAVRRLVERYGLTGCVFIGDDVTDTDAFRALREMRALNNLQAACVGVLSAETPPALLELSDITVDGVPGVVELLGWFAERL